MKQLKYVDTPTLVKLNKQAIRAHYTRCMSDECIELLDPHGYHTLNPCPVPVEWRFQRCAVAMKHIDNDEPQFVFFDVSTRAFNALKDVSKLQPQVHR